VLIENRSDREVEVIGLDLEGVRGARVKPALPLVVQAGEPRELSVKPDGDDGTVGRVIRVSVTLADGKEVEAESPPEVPMQTDALELPRPRATG
jgi:hypothetical protein